MAPDVALHLRLALPTTALLLAFVAPAVAAPPALVPPRRVDDAPVPYPAGGAGDAEVLLKVVIDSDGVVTDVELVQGASPFAEAAVAGVKAWRFFPASRDDTPIPSRIAARVSFHAPPPPPPPVSRPSAVAPLPVAPVALPPPDGGSEVVSVHGEREELGSNHIPRSEARVVPGAFGDPFRAIEALPGMAPWMSGLPYFYVRGAPPESVGYSIDGIRVPLLFHVGAGPSSLAPAIVDSVDLFPGAYPARFGRYAGAMVAGETTAPALDRAHAEFGVRVFDANAYGEVPYDGAAGSVMAAARYSYTGLLTSLVSPAYSVGYWDYQARVSHRVFGSDTLSLFAFGSYDELAYNSQPTFHVEYHRVDLRYDHPLDDGHLRVAATFSADDTLSALQTNTGAGASAALSGPGGRVRVELDERVASGANVRAGADLGVTRFDVDRYGSVAHAPHTDVEGGAYVDVVWRPSRIVEVVPGARLDGYLVRDATVVAPQPRLAAKFKITPKVTWISALGLAHQEPTEEVFVPVKLPDPIDEASRTSLQLSQAVEVRLPSSMRARVTGFFSNTVAPSVSGEERNLGGEIFVRREFTQRLGGFLAYTLSRSDTFLGDAESRSTWDRTHLFSAVLGYDLGSGWRVGARFFIESGRPYTVTCPTAACAPGSSAPASTPVTINLPPFYRLDARIEKRWTFSRGQWLAVTLEGFNVLDKAEPTDAYYSASQGVSVDTASPAILPSLGVEGGI
jgi:TonB family protein